METDDRTFGDRVSDSVAKFGGSWAFIFFGMLIIILWILFNLCIISFDPYPFILLNLFLSLAAAFQAPFVLMSQHGLETNKSKMLECELKQIKKILEDLKEGI